MDFDSIISGAGIEDVIRNIASSMAEIKQKNAFVTGIVLGLVQHYFPITIMQFREYLGTPRLTGKKQEVVCIPVRRDVRTLFYICFNMETHETYLLKTAGVSILKLTTVMIEGTLNGFRFNSYIRDKEKTIPMAQIVFDAQQKTDNSNQIQLKEICSQFLER
jgi:hypothetical protein